MVNSRNKGNTYERNVMNKYKEIGYDDAVTARNESRTTDALKIDICNTKPFSIQCKCYKQLAIARAIEQLNIMPQDENYNICHVKITSKSGPKNRKGSVVVIKEDDRMELVAMMKNEGLI